MSKKIVINGKFLSAPPTGVHRVAAELANALADLKAEAHPSVHGLDIELLLPRDGIARAAAIRLPHRVVSPFVGIPWEQLTLPFAAQKSLVLSLCNIGPALSRGAITMIHDAQVHLSPASYARPFRLWYRFIQPLFARRHRHILTVSAYSRGEIAVAGLCREDKISVIHNGVDHILRDPADLSVLNRLDLVGRPYVLALATTQAHKNIGVLLKAFADPALTGIRLVLFGAHGPDAFAAAGHALPANIVFSGRISDPALRGLMEHALCLAFPSTTEGFGLPPLEAMRLGCPAVVAPCGALPEVCADAVLYASPGKPGDWVAAIARFAASSDHRRDYAVAGRRRAAEFTWRAAAIKLAGILQMHG